MKSILASTVVLAFMTTPLAAEVIDDASYFEGFSMTIATFERDGGGNLVVLEEGESRHMPPDEYAALGFTFAPAIRWVNDADPEFDAAQAIGGSPPIAIPGAGADDFVIEFSEHVRAFGLWVVKNRLVDPPPRFTAYDRNGDVVDSVVFTGDLVDGVLGIAEYGFMGIAGDVPIARVRIQKEAAIFDDLTFTLRVVRGDVDGDRRVDFDDLLLVLAAWGSCEGCPEDLNGDGVVDFDDVLLVLSNWS